MYLKKKKKKIFQIFFFLQLVLQLSTTAAKNTNEGNKETFQVCKCAPKCKILPRSSRRASVRTRFMLLANNMQKLQEGLPTVSVHLQVFGRLPNVTPVAYSSNYVSSTTVNRWTG